MATSRKTGGSAPARKPRRSTAKVTTDAEGAEDRDTHASVTGTQDEAANGVAHPHLTVWPD